MNHLEIAEELIAGVTDENVADNMHKVTLAGVHALLHIAEIIMGDEVSDAK